MSRFHIDLLHMLRIRHPFPDIVNMFATPLHSEIVNTFLIATPKTTNNPQIKRGLYIVVRNVHLADEWIFCTTLQISQKIVITRKFIHHMFPVTGVSE